MTCSPSFSYHLDGNDWSKPFLLLVILIEYPVDCAYSSAKRVRPLSAAIAAACFDVVVYLPTLQMRVLPLLPFQKKVMEEIHANFKIWRSHWAEQRHTFIIIGWHNMKKTFRIHGIHTFKLHTKKCYSLRGEGAFLDWYEIEKVIKTKERCHNVPKWKPAST